MTLEDEQVPTPAQLESIMNTADPRTRACMPLMAFAELRPQVIGSHDGTNGLRASDVEGLRADGDGGGAVSYQLNWRDGPLPAVGSGMSQCPPRSTMVGVFIPCLARGSVLERCAFAFPAGVRHGRAGSMPPAVSCVYVTAFVGSLRGRSIASLSGQQAAKLNHHSRWKLTIPDVS